MSIDVLMTVGPKDVDLLFDLSIKSCLSNFLELNKVVLVTPNRRKVLKKIQKIGLSDYEFEIWEDKEILSADLQAYPGWLRQQVIRLYADKFSDYPFVACLSADTVLLKEVSSFDVIEGDKPILYFNRYPERSNHLDYERERVENVANILGVKPTKSYPYGDFIMDFMLFDSSVLVALRRYLRNKYGANYFTKILPRNIENMHDRVAFGEWTIYSVFLLDYLKQKPTIRNSNSQYLRQVHSDNDLKKFCFDSKIVHFVSKEVNRDFLIERINEARGWQ